MFSGRLYHICWCQCWHKACLSFCLCLACRHSDPTQVLLPSNPPRVIFSPFPSHQHVYRCSDVISGSDQWLFAQSALGAHYPAVINVSLKFMVVVERLWVYSASLSQMSYVLGIFGEGKNSVCHIWVCVTCSSDILSLFTQLCYLHAELIKNLSAKETKKQFVEFYNTFLDKGAVSISIKICKSINKNRFTHSLCTWADGLTHGNKKWMNTICLHKPKHKTFK